MDNNKKETGAPQPPQPQRPSRIKGLRRRFSKAFGYHLSPEAGDIEKSHAGGTYRFPFLSDPEFRYSPYRETLEAADIVHVITNTSEAVIKDLGIEKRITATAYLPREGDQKTPAFQRTGISGQMIRPTEVVYRIDPNNPRTVESIKTSLPRLVVHEGVHLALGQAGVAKYDTLLNVFIHEGLASVYEENWQGKFLPTPWHDALTQEQIQTEWQKAIPVLFNKPNFNSWALGEGNEHPLWSAYALGAAIVQSYIKLHPDQSMREMVRIRPTTILRESAFKLPGSTPEKP